MLIEVLRGLHMLKVTVPKLAPPVTVNMSSPTAHWMPKMQPAETE